jgi:hypothetical protein
MSSLAHVVTRVLAAAALFGAAAPLAQEQPAAGGPQSIVIGATVAQRKEAARALVPLLNDVKAHATPGFTLEPGGAGRSPLTGQHSTLFAFTISRRSVPVDSRVVAAMDRLLAWDIGGPPAPATLQLFDRWLVELQARAASASVLQASGPGLCDVNCIVQRMTTLYETWGASPQGRRDSRDELLLDTLSAAVLAEK